MGRRLRVVLVLALLPLAVAVAWLGAPTAVPHTHATDVLAAAGAAPLVPATAEVPQVAASVASAAELVPQASGWMSDVVADMSQNMSGGRLPYWLAVAAAVAEHPSKAAMSSATVDVAVQRELLAPLAGVVAVVALLSAAATGVAARSGRRVHAFGVAFVWRLTVAGLGAAGLWFAVVSPWRAYVGGATVGQAGRAALLAAAAVTAALVAGTVLHGRVLSRCGELDAAARPGPVGLFTVSILSALAIVVLSAAVWAVGVWAGMRGVPNVWLRLAYVQVAVLVGVFAVRGTVRDAGLLGLRR